ncbi:MAG: hypothetical protein IPP17_27000 [Bacteroidetes bacterium]|nr:hypothetical protein [Bacteroidota bacterium]
MIDAGEYVQHGGQLAIAQVVPEEFFHGRQVVGDGEGVGKMRRESQLLE